MKKSLITENQFNYIHLFNVSLLLFIGLTGTILYKSNLLTNSEFSSFYKFVLYFISIPITLLLRLMQWTGMIPEYKTNPLKVFWPNFDEEHYPRYYKFVKIFNWVILSVILAISYLLLTNRI
jgi:hypothetical protein